MKRLLSYGLGLTPAFAILLALGLARADPPDSADPPQATQPWTVPAFHGIDLAGVLTVEVTMGKPASVTVSGDADLVDKVTTSGTGSRRSGGHSTSRTRWSGPRRRRA